MGELHITLRGDHARRVLTEMAQRYARIWLLDTCTVRDAHGLTADDAMRLADYRFALQSVYGQELPPIPEPDWPVRYRLSDYTAKIGGPVKPGARRAPTFSKLALQRSYTAWAESFVLAVLGPA